MFQERLRLEKKEQGYIQRDQNGEEADFIVNSK